MSGQLTIAYEPSRRAELVELMADVWGAPDAGEHVEWWFEQNPVHPGVICLAEVDGELAGTLGFGFWRVVVDGTERLAAVPLRAAARERFRGRGVFSSLVVEGERRVRAEGAELGITMANEASTPGFLRDGWQPLAGSRVWMRPRRPRPGPASARPGAARYAGVEIGPLERFGAAEETAGARAASLLGDHVVADADYLNWRYADAPHEYRCFGAGEDGYAVVRRMTERGLDTGMVCTLVAATSRVTSALLARCADEARGAQLLAALRPPAHTPAWLAAGFVPTPRTMTPLGKSFADGVPLPGRTGFQFGDYDFV